MEKTKVQKWGNSLAVRLPRALASGLRLEEGTPVIIRQEQARVVIQRSPSRVKQSRLWRYFLIPTKGKKKERVSEKSDLIIYGTSR